MSTDAFLITCEHGGNDVPAAYSALFEGKAEVLATHRGWDPGALTMAHALAKGVAAAAPITAVVTRLLVDLNRSPDRPDLFSELSGVLDDPGRADVLAVHYHPYRQAVEAEVARLIGLGRRVIHISSHSFTPNLDGTERNCDVGLLYDPRRRPELEIADRWQAAIRKVSRERATPLRVRRNYPYHGRTIGFPSKLRLAWPPESYCGFELEMNQAIVAADPAAWTTVREVMVDSLRNTFLIPVVR